MCQLWCSITQLANCSFLGTDKKIVHVFCLFVCFYLVIVCLFDLVPIAQWYFYFHFGFASLAESVMYIYLQLPDDVSAAAVFWRHEHSQGYNIYEFRLAPVYASNSEETCVAMMPGNASSLF